MNTKHVKDSLFLIEPFKLVAALKKNIIPILVVSSMSVGLSAYLVQLDTSQDWKSTSKIIRYNKQITQSKDIPYQNQHFNYATALETLRSRTNLQEVIEQLNLDETPESLFSKYEIVRGRGSNIIEISLTLDDRNTSKEGANLLALTFMNNFKDIQNGATERVFKYYTIQKRNKEAEYLGAVDKLNKFLADHDVISFDNQFDIYFNVLKKINISKYETTSKIQEVLTQIEKTEQTIKTVPDEVKLKYTIRSAIKKELELKSGTRKRLLELYSKNHPKIKQINSDISEIKKRMTYTKRVEPDEITYAGNPEKGSLRMLLRRQKIELAGLRSRLNSINHEIGTASNKVDELNELNKEYSVLLTSKNDLQAQVELLSKRLYSVEVSMGASAEDFKFYEEAKLANFPENKKKKLKVIMGGVLSFLLISIIIIVREILNNKIKTRFDLTNRFGIKDTTLVERGDDPSAAILPMIERLVEEASVTSKNGPHIILTCSDLPDKEQSIISNLVEEQLKNQEQSVLRITMTRDDSSIDFSDEIHTEVHNDKSKWRVSRDYKRYLPNTKRIKMKMQKLKELKYDYILIDTPPYKNHERLLPILVKFADYFILDLNFKVSTRSSLSSFMKRVKYKDTKKIKGVLNDVHKYFYQ